MRFRDQVKDPNNENKLFVMIVDECHVGITANQAHDMIVNDFSWDNGDEAQRCKCDKSGVPHPSSGELLRQDNLVTMLVSATPYNLLTSKSRLPLKYIFSDPNNAACTIFQKDLATAQRQGEIDSSGSNGSAASEGIMVTPLLSVKTRTSRVLKAPHKA